MDLAYFSSFIRTVLIIIVAFYALRFIMKLLAPVIVQQVVKKAEQHMYESHTKQDDYRQPRQKAAEKPQEKKKVGEYIDFEEIE
ncbi:DUF4834 domain-containing protein [Flavobacterium rhizosphaerae]|uniref:DUF4834 domain-containing protein n=1 Tax=Flavobacterium rhizosphaerae TaxID=3163298 RepID=A0ABW8YTL7_9FLAO